MSALNGAITTEQTDGFAILIGQKLNFQVTNMLHAFHHENGRLGNLALDLEDMKKNMKKGQNESKLLHVFFSSS